MAVNAPPIREPWTMDRAGKLISVPWILWLQQLASVGQTEELFSDSLVLFSTTALSTREVTPTASDDIATLEGMLYTPSSSTAPSNDSEMLAWMSF